VITIVIFAQFNQPMLSFHSKNFRHCHVTEPANTRGLISRVLHCYCINCINGTDTRVLQKVFLLIEITI